MQDQGKRQILTWGAAWLLSPWLGAPVGGMASKQMQQGFSTAGPLVPLDFARACLYSVHLGAGIGRQRTQLCFLVCFKP